MMNLPLRRFRRAPENLWRKVFDGGTLFVLLVILFYIPGNYSYNSYVSINIGTGQNTVYKKNTFFIKILV